MTPSGKTRPVSIRLREDTWDFFEKMAERNGFDTTEIMRIVLEKFQERNANVRIVIDDPKDPGARLK